MIKLSKLTIANDTNHPLAVNQSLSLAEGTLTALIGRNGCGKSTLLRTLAGTQKPLSGAVTIGGLDVNRASSRDIAETIAVITTESIKVANLTCRELVAYGRSPHTGFLGRLSADDERIVDEALRSVGMESFAGRKVSQISDGESRRILLARAIAQQTPVILLDEPTSFLDVPGRYEICSLLAGLAHAQGKTIVYSTHELEPAFMNADNIMLMSETGLTLLPPDKMRKSEAFSELFTPKVQQAPRA